MFSQAEEFITSEDEIPRLDLLAWLEWYLTELETPPVEGELKLYDSNEYKKYAAAYGIQSSFGGQNKNSFDKVLTLIKFLTRFNTQVLSSKRTMENLLSGDSSHFCKSEVLYYRIEKRLSKTNNVIQNFFILPKDPDPDSGIPDKIKFIDTQVKYGELYTYKISTMNVVVGTEYKYTIAPEPEQQEEFEAAANQNVNTTGEVVYGSKLKIAKIGSKEAYLYSLGNLGNAANGTGESKDKYVLPIKVDLRPSVKMFEVPLYKESEVKICDFPPMPPLVNMYPLSGLENKILISLETQTGDRELKPISVEVADNTYFVEERFAQKRNIVYPGGGYVYPTLRFKADDASSRYEVYRIEGKMPTKYSDFAGKLHASLDTLLTIPQSSLEDDIKTNTKYYYIFRSRDMHGNVSNPSQVYEFEMVDAGQEVFYPIIKSFDMSELKNMVNKQAGKVMSLGSKALKQTVQIAPAEQQALLNEEKSGITGVTANIPNQKPVLGVVEKTIWNDKVFKFRFTSRHTGRAIDINANFNTVHDKPQEAIETCLVDESE